MPVNLMRARVRPTAPVSSPRNVDIVAMALAAALVILQVAGLVMLERSRAPAMQGSFPREVAGCAEAAASASQIPYD